MAVCGWIPLPRHPNHQQALHHHQHHKDHQQEHQHYPCVGHGARFLSLHLRKHGAPHDIASRSASASPRASQSPAKLDVRLHAALPLETMSAQSKGPDTSQPKRFQSHAFLGLWAYDTGGRVGLNSKHLCGASHDLITVYVYTPSPPAGQSGPSGGSAVC